MSSSQRTDGGGARRPDQDELSPVRDLLELAISPELCRAVDAMDAHGVPAGEQLEALRLIHGVQCGSAWNGYTMSRLQGMSRDDANNLRATGVHLAIVEFLGPDGHTGLRAEEYQAAFEAALRRHAPPE